MLTNEQLTPQLRLMRQRVQALYQQGGQLAQRNELLAAAFEELEWAIEQLQLSEAQQRLQHEEWLSERAELESEIRRFEQLFANAPAGYLVTSLDGTIRKANSAATRLLECSERHLVGRSIAMFAPEGQRREFRAQIAQIAQSSDIHDWELPMQSWERATFLAGLTACAVRGQNGERAVALHWLLRDVSEHAEATALQERAVGQPAHNGNGHAHNGNGHAHSAALPQHDLHNNGLARQRFLFLTKASAQLMVAQDVEAMLNHVANLAVPELADACVIDLVEPDGQQAQRLVVARELLQNDQVRMWRHNLGLPRARNGGQPDNSKQHEQAGRRELQSVLQTLEPASAIVAPLQAGERVIGSLTLTLGKARRQYDTIDVALAEELARQITFAVTRMRQ